MICTCGKFSGKQIYCWDCLENTKKEIEAAESKTKPPTSPTTTKEKKA